MEKYYYDTIGEYCVTSCRIFPDTKIGSATCTQCKNCKGYSQKVSWIKCSKIKKAVGE